MKHQLSRIVATLSVLFVALAIGVQQQIIGQAPMYVYSYMQITQYGDSAEVNTVSPDDPNRLIESRTFPLPEGWVFSPRFRSVVSPDGNWIASTLFAGDQSRLMVHLLNVDTWQSYQIVEGFMSANGQNVRWSPDSRYLAINIRQIGQQDIDLFIYNPEAQSLVDVSNDTADQRDIGWSINSQHVLTFSHPCNPDESCSDRLELYEVGSTMRKNVIDLVEFPFLGTSACNPQMSPDEQNVSVVSNCGIGVPFSSDFPSEVYVWNLTTGQLTRVTDYAQGQMGFLARYQHEWLNDQTLLIGVNYRIGNNPEQQQLATFQVNRGVLDILATDVGSGFNWDRETGHIALQSRRYFVDQRDGGEQAQLEFGTLPISEEDADATQIAIGTAAIDLASACESSWSPDGRLIAFTMSERDCTLYLQSITFMSPTSRTSVEHTISNTQLALDSYYVPLGWTVR